MLTSFKNIQITDFKGHAKKSWAIGWPMILIMFFEFFINLTDVYVAGHVGKDVQASYGFTSQFYFIFIVFANILSVGTVSLVSRLYTANKEEYNNAVFTVVISAFVLGVLFFGIGYVSAPIIIKILNLPDIVKSYGIPLIKIYSISILFHYFLANSNAILRASLKVKYSLVTMAIVCLLNIILDFALVFHSSLGYKGIALSTAISVLIGAVINLLFVARLSEKRCCYRFSALKKIVKIGLPIGILQLSWISANSIIYTILAEIPKRNVEVMAAFTAGMRVEAAIYLPAFAFNTAAAIIVGNLIGENKYREAYRGGWTTAILGTSIIILISLLVVLNAPWIISHLSTDPSVIKEGIRYLYIQIIAIPFFTLSLILGGGMVGAGKTLPIMIIVVSGLWIIRLPLSYIWGVVLDGGPVAVWWSMDISQIIQSLATIIYFSRKGWLKPTGL